MKTTLKFLKKLQKRVFHSIAFYPILISAAFFFLAIALIFVENLEVIHTFKKKVPYLLIQDQETARTILSSLFGGILSLTVFSFSMVMVVLNQASSNFSPRLLPGLISDKKHQIILGFYIGAQLYTIIVLMSLGAYGTSTNAVGFSVMISAVLGAACIALFVYFIHSISHAIQIHNIIDKIYVKSNNLLNKEIEEQKNDQYKNVENPLTDWKIITSDKTGYYRSFDVSLLEKSLKKHTNTIEIIPYADQHVWQGTPILKIKETITKEQEEALKLCLYILSNRHEDDSSVGGMIKLTEIAVKALSPGVNDPGTAINVISKLGQLLHTALQIEIQTKSCISDQDVIIIHNKITPEELMRIVIQPIREYCKKDSAVTYDLMTALIYIQQSNDILLEYRKAITSEINALCLDLKENINNRTDSKRILDLVKY